MRDTFSIKVLPDTLTKSAAGLITGKIHAEADSIMFPEYEWDDFVVIVLCWWLESISGLIAGREKRCTCEFMDGPFQFNIEVKDLDIWMIQFVERRLASDECLLQSVFSPQEIIGSVLSAAKLVINLCLEKGWTSTDITTLVERYEEMSQFVPGH